MPVTTKATLLPLFLSMVVFTAFSVNVYAAEADPGCERIKQQFQQVGGGSVPGALAEQCASPGGIIKRAINIGLGISAGLAVLFLTVGAVRYMTAAGNTATMAEARKAMTWSAVGLTVILMAYAIVSIVTNLVTG